MIDIKNITVEQIKEFLKDEQYRKYIISGGVVLFSVAYLVLLVVPRFLNLGDLASQIKDTRNKVEMLETRINRSDKMKIKLAELEKELTDSSEGLSEDTEIPVFLEELSSVAEIAGVTILSITPQESRAVDKNNDIFYSESSIIITAKSGYHQLRHFVSNIEIAKRFISIGDLKIQYNDRTPRKHDIKMVLKTYVSE
ncbi:MAG: type 4a pilus biogenesis protein PilO [Candidatus Omnitrophota bacterium]